MKGNHNLAIGVPSILQTRSWATIWGRDGKLPPNISGTAARMTMKFLPDVKYHKEAQNPKQFFT